VVTRAASLGVNFVIRRVNGWHTLFGNWSENLKTQYAYAVCQPGRRAQHQPYYF